MDEGLSALRSVAHPVRLRILSMLTAQPMSAAEVARELDLTHANASYHLRVLHDAGELVVESEEKIRGGTAKRYRYQVGGNPRSDRAVEQRGPHRLAARHHAEIVRRLATGSGPAILGHRDLGDAETWERAMDRSRRDGLLHEEAQPPGPRARSTSAPRRRAS